MGVVRRPGRVLRERDHITLVVDEIADSGGGAVYGRMGDRAVIVLSPRLEGRARVCALAHELVHDDLAVTVPPATAATMQTVERIVRRRTARWLVPVEDLAAFVATRSEVEPVTAELVADEFDVTVEVAATALGLLSSPSSAGR